MNNNMENSNNNLKSNKRVGLAMPIIALAVFVVFIFGATYAYYTTSVTLNNGVVNTNLDMPAKAAGCTISCDKTDIVLNTSNITTANMLTNSTSVLDTKTVTCTVNYGGTDSHTAGTKCQFNVTWNWVSTGANIYNTTANAQYAGWTYQTSGNATFSKKTSDTAIPGSNSTIATVSVTGSDTAAASQTFVFTTKFTRTTTSQDVMAGKVFRAKLNISGASIVPA